jgi:predicted regulator of Ras-like GTPase activity (Roadblock/LC7/MglB family)
VKHILTKLNETITARGSIVVAHDGMLIASVARDGIDEDRLGALGAAIVTEVGASMKRTGLDGLSHLEIAAEHGKVILTEAGPTYLLVLVGPRLEIGPGSLEIQSAATRIARAAEFHPNAQQ